MVLVTPYVVRAVAQKDLSRPDDGFADPNDPSTVLLGRLNRIYGVDHAGQDRAAGRLSRQIRFHPRLRRDEETIDDSNAIRRSSNAAAEPRCALLAAAGLAAMLAGCYDAARLPKTTRTTIACVIRSPCRKASTPSRSSSARNRGGLTPAQRADVLAFAQLWRREATGGIIVDVPQANA